MSVSSMSGFGRGTAARGDLKVVCEIRTVNHRHLDMAFSLPPEMAGHEPALRRWVSSRLRRGRVEISVSLACASGGGTPVVDERLARWYGARLKKLCRVTGMRPPGGEVLAHLPGVFGRIEKPPAPGRALPLVRQAVGRALDRVQAMRDREGAVLSRDLVRRAASLERDIAWLAEEWPKYQQRQRDKTDARVRALLERIGDENKTGPVRELLAAVERGDVSEELTRLRSHLGQLRAALRAGSPAGRKLDFLVQEIQREVHTVGAKTGDAGMAGRIVEMKEEVERVREQVQNLE